MSQRMTREEFTSGFEKRLRYVLQKHQRALFATGSRADHDAIMLDGAIAELAEFVGDALELKAVESATITHRSA